MFSRKGKRFPNRSIVSRGKQQTAKNEIIDEDEPPNPLLTKSRSGLAAERQLASFDACIETVDAMAAASSSSDAMSSRSLFHFATPLTGGNSRINDCSVCVSPDGLLITKSVTLMEDAQDLDLDASIVVGYDGPGNDKVANGFTALGWSAAATSRALRQCVDALQATGKFAESVCRAKEHCANDIRDASRIFFDDIWEAAAFSPKTSFKPGLKQCVGAKDDRPVEIKGRDGTVKRAMRMGPLLQPCTTLHQAITDVEAYYSKSAQIESNRWRTQQSTKSQTSRKAGGGAAVVSSTVEAAQRTLIRGEKREMALHDSMERAGEAQARLNRRKADAARKWALVREAEQAVRQRMEELENEREIEKQREKEKERTKARNEMLKEKHVPVAYPMQKDVREMVSQVADSTDFSPAVSPSFGGNPVGVPAAKVESDSSSRAPSPSFPLVSKSELELKFDIPQKRLGTLSRFSALP